ncbi:amidohydrolase family protein [Paracoccus ravus]|uniref:amidohydrolase family protein n=1 Tax=Paracoccus ravus TaxID=2447760 RepID=UPI00106DD701|nr:amidohydrolase family protein [Paracoccus ravus]
MLQRIQSEFHGVSLAGRAGHWDLTLADGQVARITPSERTGGGLVTPLFVDRHVHLDKTFTADRMPRLAGSLNDAIAMMAEDAARWTEDDIRSRALAGLARAHAHGTARMRSHVDWQGAETPVAWRVLSDLACAWRGRVDLELAALTPLDLFSLHGEEIARTVAATGGILGAFVYRNQDLAAKIAEVFELAERHDLALDFHVDEGLDPEARGFDAIVSEALRRKMGGRVTCGHACALSIRPAAEVTRLLGRAAEAGIELIILPACNAWLQDADGPGTPRLRGIAPLKEARAAGVNLAIASDNVRDGFHPWGDYDMAETFRLGVLLGHLDPGQWLDAVAPGPGLTEGAPADFIHFHAASLDEMVSRAACARTVWRGGNPIAPLIGGNPC